MSIKLTNGFIIILLILLLKVSAFSETVPQYTYRVIKTYPHDKKAFTQGLAFDGGYLYEGTGKHGASTLRMVKLETGDVLQSHKLPTRFFGEGITIFEDKIIQLTWQSKIGFVYDKKNYTLLQDFHCPTEGWGITHDGMRLIISDGSATLHFLDPGTFKKIGQITVRDSNSPVTNLNELEYIHDEIYANIWKQHRIARISPYSGLVVGWIDIEDLCRWEGVPNGIAYDHARGRLFVTGKFWPHIYEIEIIPKKEF